MGRWGQKLAIFDDLQYCNYQRDGWVGLKKSKTWWRNTWMVPSVEWGKRRAIRSICPMEHVPWDPFCNWKWLIAYSSMHSGRTLEFILFYVLWNRAQPDWACELPDRTWQDRTLKFAGQVLPDRTESGLIFINILTTKHRLSILITNGPWTQIWCQK